MKKNKIFLFSFPFCIFLSYFLNHMVLKKYKYF